MALDISVWREGVQRHSSGRWTTVASAEYVMVFVVFLNLAFVLKKAHAYFLFSLVLFVPKRGKQ